MSLRQIELRASEIILLRRALRIYAHVYQDLAVKSKPKWEKDELKLMAQRADELNERLLREPRPFTPPLIPPTQETSNER